MNLTILEKNVGNRPIYSTTYFGAPLFLVSNINKFIIKIKWNKKYSYKWGPKVPLNLEHNYYGPKIELNLLKNYIFNYSNKLGPVTAPQISETHYNN